MRETAVLMLAVIAAMVVSGCAMVGRYAAPVEGGHQTTVGLIAIESISNGYPMIPFYTSFEQDK